MRTHKPPYRRHRLRPSHASENGQCMHDRTDRTNPWLCDSLRPHTGTCRCVLCADLALCSLCVDRIIRFILCVIVQSGGETDYEPSHHTTKLWGRGPTSYRQSEISCALHRCWGSSRSRLARQEGASGSNHLIDHLSKRTGEGHARSSDLSGRCGCGDCRYCSPCTSTSVHQRQHQATDYCGNRDGGHR